MENSSNLNNVVTISESIDNYIVSITTTDTKSIKKIEFFFNSIMGPLFGYINVHILNSENEQNIIRIIDVTSASGYGHLNEKLRKIYDEDGYDDSTFIKGKSADFLSFVLTYLRRNFRNRKIILVSCLEKNKPYLEPVIDDVRNRVGDIIESITGGGELASFTINLK